VIRGVFGSRNWPQPSRVRLLVQSFLPGTTLVSGGAPGVDLTAEREGVAAGLAVDSWRVIRLEPGIFGILRLQRSPAGLVEATIQDQRWLFVEGNRADRIRAFGQAAYWRNERMAGIVTARSDVFWDGRSPGTRNMIRLLAARDMLNPPHRLNGR
jgi:hypothetical protein